MQPSRFYIMEDRVDNQIALLQENNQIFYIKTIYAQYKPVSKLKGYIGSHTVIELIEAGYGVVVVDNLCNSSSESLKRVEEITGKSVTFYEADINDRDALKKIFEDEDIESCIHFVTRK